MGSRGREKERKLQHWGVHVLYKPKLLRHACLMDADSLPATSSALLARWGVVQIMQLDAGQFEGSPNSSQEEHWDWSRILE